MSRQRNKFGLERYIPTKVQKAVRRRCGFGCVICGGAIYQYEHFDPPFALARKHDPAGITLLCGAHHDQKTLGLLSVETVAIANRDPVCRKLGRAHHVFDLGGLRPTLKLGTTKIQAIGDALRINAVPFIQVHPPDLKSARWRLTAKFADVAGNLLCEIRQNELLVNVGNFDVLQTATRFLIRNVEGRVMLALELDPPRSLIISTLSLVSGHYSLTVADGILTVAGPKFGLSFEHCEFYSDTAGISVSENGLRLGGP